MKFGWNEEKRLANIEKHALDFIDADILSGEFSHIVSGSFTKSRSFA